MRGRTSLLAVIAGAAIACGGSSSSSPAPAPVPQASGFNLTITGLAYSPLNLHVPPGGTVTVTNADTTQHSVTSEASPNSYVPGSVSGISFDTGAFGAGTKTFTIPSSAPSGTVVPFYCTVHLTMMATPNGSITVDPSATPTTATGGGGGGGIPGY